MNNLKEVNFYDYCPKCEYYRVDERKDPCFECLSYPGNEDSSKPINFKGNYTVPETTEDNFGYFSDKRKVKNYLYDVRYKNLNYKYANRYFETLSDPVGIGGCSSVRNGRWYGRNYDWTYDNTAEFIVRTPSVGHLAATLGIAGGVSNLTEEFCGHEAYSELYKIVPFQLLDGINEYGLVCNMNVVPLDKGKNTTLLSYIVDNQHSPSIPRKVFRERISGLMLVRYILDNFSDAWSAAVYIRDFVSVYFPKALHDKGYELHYMIGDRSGHTYALEFVNNKAIILDISKRAYMTNFYLYEVLRNFDGTVYTPETQYIDELGLNINAISANNITPNGSGLERWNYIVDHYSGANCKYGMRVLMNGLKYTKAYSTSSNPSNPFWYTEFVGARGLTCGDPSSLYSEVVNIAGGYYTNRSRTDGGLTWHTVHSSIYDMLSLKLYLIVQEDGKELEFWL